MIQINIANNTNYNTHQYSLELKEYMEQIATTENLREQLVNQIYIITNIQKSINDNSIVSNIDNLLSQYNNSIASINGAIITTEDKVSYFDIKKEKSSYEKQIFTTKLATKCQEIEVVFEKIVTLNAQAINKAKLYIQSHKNENIEYSNNININNARLLYKK